MATMTLGPVIGKVTDTSARVLIEVDTTIQVTCVATASPTSSVTHTITCTRDRPAVFKLKNLAPQTQYELTFQGVSENPRSRLRTFSSTGEKLNVAAVSCNYLGRRGRDDLWADLRDRYVTPGDVDLLLHVGDQIYGDSAFARALTTIKDNTLSPAAQDERILNDYRGLYRSWWTDKSTRDVLANVSNLMIWDDHEIRDDWGSKDSDCDKTSDEYRIGTLARKVYREYQRQLWDDFDINLPPATGEEQHWHRWGPIGVIFVDQRGGRSFGREPARPYLSTLQWNKIVAALASGGELSAVRALIVVTSVPLCYLGSRITGQGTGLSDDLYDHWSHPKHAKEQIEMLRELRRWKEAGKGQRELLVVGGDVHVGGHTNIEHVGATIFKQLITSPITNHPPKWYEFLGLQVLTEAEERLTDSYSYEHHDLTNKRNYGFILVRVPPTGLPRVEGSLVKAT